MCIVCEENEVGTFTGSDEYCSKSCMEDASSFALAAQESAHDDSGWEEDEGDMLYGPRWS
jgi:hypothetical protein